MTQLLNGRRDAASTRHATAFGRNRLELFEFPVDKTESLEQTARQRAVIRRGNGSPSANRSANGDHFVKTQHKFDVRQSLLTSSHSNFNEHGRG